MLHVDASDAAETLLYASRALVGVAARSLADVEVTLPQFRALVVISESPRTTVSALGSALGIHSTSASRLCDRLVRKRLIQRVEGSDDRRETELRLAAEGQRLVDRVSERRRADLLEIVERMGAEVTADVVRALQAFAAAADEHDADVLGWTPVPR